jgi:hypothetical protein
MIENMIVSADPLLARQSQIMNQNGVQATSGFEMCFAVHTPETSALS